MIKFLKNIFMKKAKNKHENKFSSESKHKHIIESVLFEIKNDEKLAHPIFIYGMTNEEQSKLFGNHFPLQYIWNEYRTRDGKMKFNFSLNKRVVERILEKTIPRMNPDFIDIRNEILKALHFNRMKNTINILEKVSLKPSLAFKQYDYQDLVSTNTANVSIIDYDKGQVSIELLEEAIDFIINHELADPTSTRSDEEYENNQIHQANQIIRTFGEQISPRTLENMEAVFYSITNSNKYRESAKHYSVACSSLKSGWNGIGPWQY